MAPLCLFPQVRASYGANGKLVLPFMVVKQGPNPTLHPYKTEMLSEFLQRHIIYFFTLTFLLHIVKTYPERK
jgi:hypothetical protein